MAFDREEALKKAEKLLRQGKLEPAIAEYVRVVEDQPRDWTTANTLGDLYVRAGQIDKAVAQYRGIADHLLDDGFYPKANALYKKLYKLVPDDEDVQLQLADISVRLGLLLDAKNYLNILAKRRTARGDRAGAADIIVRLGEVDPADVDARLAAARMLAQMGEREKASGRLRALHDYLNEKGRAEEAFSALRESVKLNPSDREGRGVLAKAALAAGDFDAARTYLDRDTAGDDPALLSALLDLELEAGRVDDAREIVPMLLAMGREARDKVVETGWRMTPDMPDAAFVCIDSAVDAAAAAGEFEDAAALLQEFAARVPGHVPSLQKLIEVCVDGKLESAMQDAQAQLADAYLDSGQAAEARIIAEDLVARQPWETAHIERFRRALRLLKVWDPDTVIADRLSGQTPFIARDPFVDERAAAETAMPPAVESAVAEPPVSPPVDGPGVDQPVPAAAAPAPTPAARAGAADEIDLTTALGGLSGARAADAAATAQLDSVFQKVRRQVARQSTDHSAHHMTLARTYLEMGMTNEAIGALETAVKSPLRRYEAASMLGRLYRDRGDAASAIEWLERASEAPPPDPEAGHALLYDLGVLLDETGDTARALALLLELQSDAGDYRDVPQRIDRLARVQTGG